jgi:hypothetical protein
MQDEYVAVNMSSIKSARKAPFGGNGAMAATGTSSVPKEDFPPGDFQLGLKGTTRLRNMGHGKSPICPILRQSTHGEHRRALASCRRRLGGGPFSKVVAANRWVGAAVLRSQHTGCRNPESGKEGSDSPFRPSLAPHCHIPATADERDASQIRIPEFSRSIHPATTYSST